MDININPIIRKVSIIGDDFEFSFVVDETEYAKDLIRAGCNGLNEQNIYDYFAEGEFTDEDIEKLNGKHFIFGFLETLGQSEKCPDVLFSYTGKLTYKVEIVDKNNIRKENF